MTHPPIIGTTQFHCWQCDQKSQIHTIEWPPVVVACPHHSCGAILGLYKEDFETGTVRFKMLSSPDDE